MKVPLTRSPQGGFGAVFFFFGREKRKGSREKNQIFRDFAREKQKGSREKF